MRLYVPFATIASVSIFCLSVLGGCQQEPADPANAVGQTTADDGITAAGSSFAAPMFNKWLEVYGTEHAELSLSYASIGSGAGIERFLAQSVDIGTTDAPLRDTEAAQIDGDFAQLPITGGMIAIAYNLPDFPGPLNLPRDVYTEIFLGNAFRRDDPRIAAANPGLALPHQLIQVVGRRDSSGTTLVDRL
ncbi:phosphate ABC transporter substrate-binding protein PstS [Halochromatium glycolicum]|uniref:PBP domain-containing protein n=1 Tax=Halochromatium glycolicum TaxID=85075 RepID=A0AAJ0U579_9GAMM|nr:phosphate ABC transporter substrate-binding protein PstS [Halochromatium glycolicum]MBK1705504.1 hypothetical protein [Halochromatium glycolicum]